MAACKLVIKFDDSRPRTGGEPITGTITVVPEKQVSCKGLVARCIWSTHGRGNIDTGQVDSQTLYEGTWLAGQEYTYPFKLNTATWPPTYYGTYLNVGHYVAAQAKLSWAIDPKAQVEFPVIAATAPDDLKPTTAPDKSNSVVGMVIGSIVLVFVLGIFGAFMLFLIPLIAVAAGLLWFFKVFLPKRITGPVSCELKTPKIMGGQTVEAHLDFTPQRSSKINGVEWTISCVEACTSGSGSNRTTHRHQVLKETQRASETLQLKAGQKQSFDFVYVLPTSAAPSLKFSNNQTAWSVDGRIDIPGWPDWIKKMPLIVSPHPDTALGQRVASEDDDEDDYGDDEGEVSGELTSRDSTPVGGLPPVVTPVVSEASTKADDAWFRQVIVQIQQSQHDHEQMAMVISAVRDFEFPITASIEDEIDTPEFEDDAEFGRLEDWEWWTAYCPAQNISLALAWPEYPAAIKPGATWSGTASIVGYDLDAKRVLMQVKQP